MKHSSIVIESPERIRFTYELAEGGSRAAAYVLDLLFQGLVIVAFFVACALLGLLGLSFNLAEPVVSLFSAATMIFFFLLQWGYYIFFETVMRGRSPGKRALKLRVIRADGLPLDFRSIVLRNLLRGADCLPLGFIPLLGGLVSLIDPRWRRLGDIVAGTLVIRDRASLLLEPTLGLGAYGPGLATGLGRYGAAVQAREVVLQTGAPVVPGLNEVELLTIRKFLSGYGYLPAARAETVALAFAIKLAARLGPDRSRAFHLALSPEAAPYSPGTVPGGEPIPFLKAVYDAQTRLP